MASQSFTKHIKKRQITLTTRDFGNWLNLKVVLYFGGLGKFERLRIFNP